MNPTYEWYTNLIKPAWAPPSFLFGPVWSVLYIMIAISFGTLFKMAWNKQVSIMVALPFILNIIFNLMFTPLQFGLRNNWLALVDIILVWVTLLWMMVVIYPVKKWLAYIQVPYLLWVSFATILQTAITYLNYR